MANNKLKKEISISDQRRFIEIGAVVITGIGKFLFMDFLNFRFVYISFVCVFWIGYIAYRFRQNAAILKYWGLSTKHFKKTFLELLPLVIVVILFFIFTGNKLGTNILNWKIIPILLLYPIWGIIQQFVMIGIIAKNMKDLKTIQIQNVFIVFITAFVFAIVHYPHMLLIIGTFFLALVYTSLYLKNRNLIVLGIYHGWIGAFFFYTILERDPWKEVFEMITL